MLRCSTRNAARYVGAEKADEYGRLNAGEGSAVVRVSSAKIIAENNITGE